MIRFAQIQSAKFKMTNQNSKLANVKTNSDFVHFAFYIAPTLSRVLDKIGIILHFDI